MTYLVMAFRFGWINNHWYLVYGGPDRTRACALAADEARLRGGKYSCAVYEFSDLGTEYQLITYEGSTLDEKEPEHNERIEYHRRLGQFADEYASGLALLPDPANPNMLIYTTITAPDEVVVEEVKRQKLILAAFCRARAAAAARGAP